jgi:hypothetical protein
MKNIIYYLLIFVCLTFTACNDWLDVQPKTEFEQNKMFETEKGFQDVLIGAYINLKGNDMYGENLSMGVIEFLAQHWKGASPKSTKDYFFKYDYENTGVKSVMSGIYAKMYNTIANINLILKYIDAKKDVFSKGMYELIKGEALAIRAYCHFEILRLFGPVPSATTTGMNIPYVKTLSKEYHPLHSYTEYTKLLQEDLDKAEIYLKKIDPIASGKLASSTLRKLRMNYYAVLGTKARFYLWTQKKDSAYKYAKKIITNNDNNFELGGSTDLVAKDYNLKKEHILSLTIRKFDDIVKRFNLSFKGDKTYTLTKTFIQKEVYENNSLDIRYNGYWFSDKTENENVVTTTKYLKKNNKQTIGYIPLMRLYEMYLIAIESAPTLTESNALFTKIRNARGMTAFNLISENIQQEVIKEYRKEFYAEGLMFYTYKRLYIKNMLGGNKVMTEKDYVIPLPDTEIVKK